MSGEAASSLRPRIAPVLLVAPLLIAFTIRGDNTALIILPGTQPGQASEAEAVINCKPCHVRQVEEWAGSMEAQAARDPLFNAVLAVTMKKYIQGLGHDVGEYCLRCHAPTNWLLGRSHPGSTENFPPKDLDAVNCDFCHRSLDPLATDSTAIVEGTVPGYGNGMYVVQQSNLPVRGARGTTHPAMPTRADAFYRSSEYCAVCHEESNPYLSADPWNTTPWRQVPVERTYSEWKLSWFASQGEAGSCQSCHMPRSPGYAATFPVKRYRLDVASHDFSGGCIFPRLTVSGYWPNLDTTALRSGAERSASLLRTAAGLEVAAGRSGDSVHALVRVVNLIGHKIPSGFPDGRRMWLDVTGRDALGKVVFRSGAYDAAARHLIRDEQIKIYEVRSGISHAGAITTGFPAGPSFHTELNDSVWFDNRIPPRGYSAEAFRQHRAEPVGAAYADGQYWDEVLYRMPGNAASVEASLYYEVASDEYISFLREENRDNPYDWNHWGDKVYDSWWKAGAPVLVTQKAARVGGGVPELPPVAGFEIPVDLRLAQNFPNPFNGQSTIEFWIKQGAHVTVRLYDMAGREVLQVVDEDFPAGPHTVSIDASGLASGVYLYRAEAQRFSVTRKLIILR